MSKEKKKKSLPDTSVPDTFVGCIKEIDELNKAKEKIRLRVKELTDQMYKIRKGGK